MMKVNPPTTTISELLLKPLLTDISRTLAEVMALASIEAMDKKDNQEVVEVVVEEVAVEEVVAEVVVEVVVPIERLLSSDY
jgi:Tfp pilus assembly ATPase PilU